MMETRERTINAVDGGSMIGFQGAHWPRHVFVLSQLKVNLTQSGVNFLFHSSTIHVLEIHRIHTEHILSTYIQRGLKKSHIHY